jgi:N-acetyl-gamma-glutamyl-phosphate reductase
VTVRVGIGGVNGYGGRELMRLCLAHPEFRVTYVAGESTAGQVVSQLFPALEGHPAGQLVVQPFVPEEVAADLLFASLPTGASREPLARVARDIKIVDVGGDHRYAAGWVYGLTELPGARDAIRGSSRVADPGCYAATSLLALAPLVASGLIEVEGIVVDAKSGISGAGRGGGSGYGFAETNEDVVPYGLLAHDHVREMTETLSRLAGGGRRASLAFTPHLVPMTRGIVATCYGRPRGSVTTAQAIETARAFYQDEPFIHVREVEQTWTKTGSGVHSKWATGTNLTFLTYAVNAQTGHVIAAGALDNLGKGAAGQAIQNANLMTGQPESAGLTGAPLWP